MIGIEYISVSNIISVGNTKKQQLVVQSILAENRKIYKAFSLLITKNPDTIINVLNLAVIRQTTMHHIVTEDIQSIIKTIKKDAKVLEGKTVLVTGSCGFLGSYFMATLNELNKSVFKKPCKIIAVDNHIIGNKENILGDIKSKHITWIKRDICKPVNFKGPIDYIIHAAGIASPAYYMKFPLETIEVSTQGVKRMLELAKEKKSKGMLFFSSSEIYGDPHPEYIPTPETYRGHVSSTGPRSCYDESKRLGETICMTHFRLFNTPIKIIRPFNVYGPGMKPDDHRVLPKFLNCALQGEELPIHGNGLQTRTYSYVSDAIVGFFKVLFKGAPGEIYNIGSDQNEINLVNLANTVADIFPGRVKIKKIPYPKNYPGDEASRRCPDLTKAKTQLAFNPKIELKDGASSVLQWYKDEFYQES